MSGWPTTLPCLIHLAPQQRGWAQKKRKKRKRNGTKGSPTKSWAWESSFHPWSAPTHCKATNKIQNQELSSTPGMTNLHTMTHSFISCIPWLLLQLDFRCLINSDKVASICHRNPFSSKIAGIRISKLVSSQWPL